jgi:hypothetical protein
MKLSVLARALPVLVWQQEKGWMVGRDDLRIYGIGETIEDALKGDNGDSRLLDDDETYALADEATLTDEAQALAQTLLAPSTPSPPTTLRLPLTTSLRLAGTITCPTAPQRFTPTLWGQP